MSIVLSIPPAPVGQQVPPARPALPADAAAPAGAQVLDLSGKFIIPGLFDSHVHWQEWMGEFYVNHGVTSVMALENMPKALRAKSQDAADLPRFFHSGGRPSFTEGSPDADIGQAVRNWLVNEPDLASPFQVRSATVQHRQHGGVNGRGKGRGQGL
jgi:hypothetical protein